MHIWYCLYFVASVLCRGNKKNQTRSVKASNVLLTMLLNHFSSLLNMNRIFFSLASSRVLWRQSCARPLEGTCMCTLAFSSTLLLRMFVSKTTSPCIILKDAVAGSNSSLKHTHTLWTALSNVGVSGCTVHQSCKVDRQCTCTCRTQLWTGPTEPLI